MKHAEAEIQPEFLRSLAVARPDEWHVSQINSARQKALVMAADAIDGLRVEAGRLKGRIVDLEEQLRK